MMMRDLIGIKTKTPARQQQQQQQQHQRNKPGRTICKRTTFTAILVPSLISIVVEFFLFAAPQSAICYAASDSLEDTYNLLDSFAGQLGPPSPVYRVEQPQHIVAVRGDDIVADDNDDDDDDNTIARNLVVDLGDPPLGQAVQVPRYNDLGELDLARLLALHQQQQQQQQQRTPILAPKPAEVYLLEDKDYPKSLFEDYAQRVGQVSGITTLPRDEVVIFHRASHHWDESTFDEASKQIPLDKRDDLIKDKTIMIIDGDGNSLKSFGANLFYMPHSIAGDSQGNLWVSDVARHQVMRLPSENIARIPLDRDNTNSSGSQIWPDIILGEAFVPGQDTTHFCQPSEIAVSLDGALVYVADGYCNQRVMVFSGATGRYVASFGQQDDIRVVHSLTLIEEKNLLCVADRENARILCYNAGLKGELQHLGELQHRVDYPIGKVFAITSISPDHLLVSSQQVGTSHYDLAILNPFSHELKLVWTSSDLLEPHSLATTFVDRQYAYAADLSKDAYKKVFKFRIIQRV